MNNYHYHINQSAKDRFPISSGKREIWYTETVAIYDQSVKKNSTRTYAQLYCGYGYHGSMDSNRKSSQTHRNRIIYNR